MPRVPDTTLSPADARARVEAQQWYHTIDLGQGLVTAGWFDTRPTTSIVPMPASLAGKRCLDVGTWDGFWAFEMERRGAASVTAIDVDDQDQWDWPPRMRMARSNSGRDAVEAFKQEGAGFRIAHEVLGSGVERRDFSVYDLSPETIGTFDFVFLGSLLLHLRDPVRALAAIRSVCSGEAVIADTVDFWSSMTRRRTPTARLEGVERPWWWIPNVPALHQMVRSAGFDVLEATSLYFIPLGAAHPKQSWRAIPGQLRTALGRAELVTGFKGLPHAAVRVRPATV
jgi:tRNA (mo5U34)-methyltransferase